jgi:hypothetical protein
MLWSALVLVAAAAYGLATILQAVGTRRVAAGAGLDVRLLVRLSRSAPYVAGLALDAAAFALTVVALRHLPVYLVQSAVAANLAVVAVLARLFLGASFGTASSSAVVTIGVLNTRGRTNMPAAINSSTEGPGISAWNTAPSPRPDLRAGVAVMPNRIACG